MPGIEKPIDHWKLRTRTLTVGDTPLVMGIVNVTPDSFSDGGRFLDADAAVEHGLRLVAEGADILDVGGKSTRPGSHSVDVQEELRRVMPVLGALCRQAGVPVSIDTTKSLVARHALNAGAEIINDITALESDPGMLPLAVESGCGVCVMHMRGEPRTMQDDPVYGDVVAEVAAYLRQRRDAAMAAGVVQDRIALDPGIGFGKTTTHNLQLLANAWQFHALGCPVLVGHSRKRFLTAPQTPGEFQSKAVAETPVGEHPTDAPAAQPRLISLPTEPADRAAGTIGVALSLARQRVQIIRVHDVAAVQQAMFFFKATGGLT
ncbi:MAG: dihydropteroate synthase [Planctomycetaceae bacterium]|nr:dihydropteroate synthase [Planctomycetaceae bacterium]